MISDKNEPFKPKIGATAIMVSKKRENGDLSQKCMCQLNVQMFQKTQKYFCIEQQHKSTNQTDNHLSRKEKTREKLINI
jgi:hypothetical protein